MPNHPKTTKEFHYKKEIEAATISRKLPQFLSVKFLQIEMTFDRNQTSVFSNKIQPIEIQTSLCNLPIDTN